MSSVRRDRDGSVLEDDHDQAQAHYCVDGWLGLDVHGRPRPCPRCKPHLFDSRGRARTRRDRGR